MDRYVLVTVEKGETALDLELPWEEKLSSLYPRLNEALAAVSAETFGRAKGIVLEKNGAGLLNGNATLKEYGVVSGDILQAVYQGKYYGWRDNT